MDSADLGTLGFWICLAAVGLGVIWSGARQEAEKHETLRRILEKTGTLDEDKLKELFSPASPQSSPGGGYRALRIAGTVIMSIGAALMVFFGIMALVAIQRGPLPMEAFAPLSVAAGACMLGLGVFFSSRFAEPPGSRNEPPAK